MASKGQKFKQWTKEEKLRIVKKIVEDGKSSYIVGKEENILSTGMIRRWTKLYIEFR
jgi:transposase-like protein